MFCSTEYTFVTAPYNPQPRSAVHSYVVSKSHRRYHNNTGIIHDNYGGTVETKLRSQYLKYVPTPSIQSFIYKLHHHLSHMLVTPGLSNNG